MVCIRRIVSQQLRQGARSGLMHGGSHRGLNGFQIEPAMVATLLKNNPQELVYFVGNFLLDGLRSFFSWVVCSVCLTGRKRQIFRLTSTSWPVRA